jgi:hypothetical protein
MKSQNPTNPRAKRQAWPECTGPEKAMAGDARYPVKFG